MTTLIISVLVVLIVSALCSLSEAAIYAVRMPYIRQLNASGHAAGPRLEKFKRNMERPITAILILNTASNTAGAAVAGAQARLLFGEGSLFWFSAFFTLAVLFISEIIPKVAGVAFNRPLSRMLSSPLELMIRGLFPVVWLSQRITSVFQSDEPVKIASKDEVRHFADMSAEEGSILPFESELIKNVLQLNDVVAKDIMSPRTVVTRTASQTTVGELAESVSSWQHTRIPVFRSDDPEEWIGFVLKDEVISKLASDQFDVPIESMCKPLGFAPETAPGHFLLNEFIKKKQHILGVVDEYGGLVGVVTLEDVLESLIGQEIVDESDRDEDMRAAARRDAAGRINRPENSDEDET
ncbi:MAG: hypothetical protein DHS20C16_09240 [Phycisphaerae bacterium]|nr:MAG: hypothetical protein DHS20C16_09240 [Phycisphaerae bacterium]